MSRLDAIQASLQKLRDLGQATLVFPVPHHDMRVKIRLLYPGEEHQIHTAADAVPDEVLPYIDAYHLESLSRVLMAVWKGEQQIFDFTGVTRMSTDYDQELIKVIIEETNGEGKMTTKEKWMGKEALLRPVLVSWGRDLKHVIFKKYKELSNEQQVLTQQGIEFKHDTIEDEIKVLSARLDGLKSKLRTEEILSAATDTFSEIMQKPLDAAQTEQVEEHLVVRDSRVERPLVEPEPVAVAPEPQPAPGVPLQLPEPREPEPVTVTPEPEPEVKSESKSKTIQHEGGTFAVKHEEGGVLDAPKKSPAGPIPHDEPPVGTVNPDWAGGGRTVRDRSSGG